MALILKKIYHGYFWVFADLADPRANKFFANPFVMLGIASTYVYSVKVLGPKLMENRKPFELKNTMIIYNIIQIVSNFYLGVKLCRAVWNTDWDCASVDYNPNSPRGIEEQQIAYMFLGLKMLDFVDTIIFVLRKSYRQISFLHVYHHTAMFFALWVATTFVPGGEGLTLACVNCFVHVFMFSYYLLSAIDPKWKNSLVLKKALTQIQLMQFMYFLYNYGRLLFKPSCNYPILIAYLLTTQNVFMSMLFGEFYIKTYILKKNK